MSNILNGCDSTVKKQKISFSQHNFSISFQHSYFHLLQDVFLALFTLIYELPVWLSKHSSSPSKTDGSSNLKIYILLWMTLHLSKY